ncbi:MULTISPECIES: hypothetical protein [Streptomyces]|uniref:hypothetical protein n=1 Tax=Streptomyces TaxID=1883 RepID=UPI0021A4851A|nr:hypothetical protein [Streptomyces atratus]MCT2544074.1 hypothetical protein [Streptomyces atratus]
MTTRPDRAYSTTLSSVRRSTILCVQHRWPAIGEAIDIATKVLITLIGLLIFASNGTTGQNPPTSPAPAPSVSAAPADQDQGPGGGQ